MRNGGWYVNGVRQRCRDCGWRRPVADGLCRHCRRGHHVEHDEPACVTSTGANAQRSLGDGAVSTTTGGGDAEIHWRRRANAEGRGA